MPYNIEVPNCLARGVQLDNGVTSLCSYEYLICDELKKSHAC